MNEAQPDVQTKRTDLHYGHPPAEPLVAGSTITFQPSETVQTYRPNYEYITFHRSSVPVEWLKLVVDAALFTACGVLVVLASHLAA